MTTHGPQRRPNLAAFSVSACRSMVVSICATLWPLGNELEIRTNALMQFGGPEVETEY